MRPKEHTTKIINVAELSKIFGKHRNTMAKYAKHFNLKDPYEVIFLIFYLEVKFGYPKADELMSKKMKKVKLNQ